MKSKALLATVLSSSLLISTLALPIGQTASAASNNDVAAPATYSVQTVQTSSELDKLLKEENVSHLDMVKYGMYVKANAGAQAQKPGSGDVSAEWKVSAVKKAAKFAVDHADAIPSKSIRDFVKNNGGIIVKAADKITTGTKAGLKKALMSVGISEKWAEIIANFIVTFFL